jgi:hypothetical protein
MTQINPDPKTVPSTANNTGGSSLSKSQEKYFKENIAPLEKEFENLRIEAISSYIRGKKIILASFSLLTLAWIYPLDKLGFMEFLGFMVLFFLLIGSLAALQNLLKYTWGRYSKIYDDKVYPAIFNYFDDEFTFSRECPRPLDELKRFGILPSFNWVTRLNYVRGRYKTVDIELLNTKLTQVKGYPENTRFNGLLILLTLKKPFLGRTIITSDKVLVPVLILGGLQCIRLESSEFNKVFNVYSEDQIEARTLLTPASMLRFLDLQKLINQRVNYSFYSGKLLIPFDNVKNNFGLQPIHKKMNIRQKFKGICDDMQIIFDIVDVLKLDLDIGL